MDAAWLGVGGTLLGALIGFLAAAYSSRRMSEAARQAAFGVYERERQEQELTLRYALAQELRANSETLRLATGREPQLSRVQRVAWESAIAIRFSKLEHRNLVQRAYAEGAILDVALDYSTAGMAGSPHAEAYNAALAQAAAAYRAFEEAERVYRVNELPESRQLGTTDYIR